MRRVTTAKQPTGQARRTGQGNLSELVGMGLVGCTIDTGSSPQQNIALAQLRDDLFGLCYFCAFQRPLYSSVAYLRQDHLSRVDQDLFEGDHLNSPSRTT